jgi:hypothetical protein
MERNQHLSELLAGLCNQTQPARPSVLVARPAAGIIGGERIVGGGSHTETTMMPEYEPGDIMLAVHQPPPSRVMGSRAGNHDMMLMTQQQAKRGS